MGFRIQFEKIVLSTALLMTTCLPLCHCRDANYRDSPVARPHNPGRHAGRTSVGQTSRIQPALGVRESLILKVLQNVQPRRDRGCPPGTKSPCTTESAVDDGASFQPSAGETRYDLAPKNVYGENKIETMTVLPPSSTAASESSSVISNEQSSNISTTKNSRPDLSSQSGEQAVSKEADTTTDSEENLEELRKFHVEKLKREILRQLGLQEPPNITTPSTEGLPAPMREVMQRQLDEQSYKASHKDVGHARTVEHMVLIDEGKWKKLIEHTVCIYS